MGTNAKSIAAPKASSNWRSLQKRLPSSSSEKSSKSHQKPNVVASLPPSKKRKLAIGDVIEGRERLSVPPDQPSPVALGKRKADAGDSLDYLRSMVLGQIEYDEESMAPGRYIAIDCEMVGVGLDGAESSLARVSVVNYHGAIQLDEFVRQRERVVDYRTEFSGIRESDMIKALPFSDVQKRVAELLQDRILVGHAVFNDLKALLLSHPRPFIRDTQQCASRHKLMKSRYPALRKLVDQELGLEIQTGEHSSVTDARATMAVFRLHRKEWEKGFKQTRYTGTSAPESNQHGVAQSAEEPGRSGESKQKRKRNPSADFGGPRESSKSFPGGGRKGVSSGLSTVTKFNGRATKGSSGDNKWWKKL